MSGHALWLVRHAQPLVEAGTCYGATDLEADATDTQRAAQALAARLPQGLAVWCSPRLRCLQLAQALRTLRPDLGPVALDARLAEMDFGCWEGWRWSDIPRADLEAWTTDFADHAFGGRESVQQLLARVEQAWQQALLTDAPVVWITHAGVMRAAMLLARGERRVGASASWPSEPIAFGESLCLVWRAPPARA